MRARLMILALGAVAVVLLAGCTPTPEPEPAPSASPSSIATQEPVTEPETAFDVSCADIDEALASLVGDSDGPVDPVLSLASAPNWYPGPAQHMFPRSGGIACSTGDLARGWEVTLTPQAETVIAGAEERNGWFGEGTQCFEKSCMVSILDRGVLLMARIDDPALGEGDAGRVTEGLGRLAARAADSLHETELGDSEIAGIPCERLLTAEWLAEQLGTDIELTTRFDGWGIPAETYHVVNGAEICHYSDGGAFDGDWKLTITSLPGGAWAFEKMPGEPVEVEGADAALAGEDVFGRAVLDLRAGPDWIRLTTPAGEGGPDAVAAAEQVLSVIGKGVPAPQ